MAAAKVTALKDFRKLEAAFLEDAVRLGLDTDFLFQSTLARYRTQIDLLARLQTQIENSPPTVQKSYAQGAKNDYINPCISEFNRTASAANQTCSLLNRLKAAAEKNAAEDFEDDEL